jgi:predicted permease
MPHAVPRWLNGCLALALRCYPAAFRRRFGPSMTEAFVERVSSVQASRGRLSAASLAVRAVMDVALGGLRERWWLRRRTHPPSRQGVLMESWMGDVRFGVRLFRRSPGVAVASILVLALGIGSTSTVFGLINALLIDARVERPAGVMGLYSRDGSRPDLYRGFSYPALVDLRAREGLFDGIAGQTFAIAGIREGEITRRVFTGIVTAGFFDTLGAPVALGRDFSAAEEEPGADIPVTVISQQLWRRLGGRAGIVGTTLQVNNRAFTVIGVTRPGFTGSSMLFGPELWLPTGVHGTVASVDVRDSQPLDDRGNYALIAVTRLPDGRDVATWSERLSAAARELEQDHPVAHANQEFVLAQLSRASIGTRPGTDDPVTGVLVALLAMAGIVMLIGALNVANMLLAQGGTRRKEIAVRVALGSSRARLVRQLLTEGLLLAAGGAVIGVALAAWISRVISTTIVSAAGKVMQAEFQLDARPDGIVLLASLAASLVCTLAFSLGPAMRAVRRDAAPELGHHAGEIRRGRRGRAAELLVAGQVALSLVLLALAALFVRMSVASASMDPGFAMDRGVLVNVDPGLAGYDRARTGQTYVRLLDRLRAVPDVEAASLASIMPFGSFTVSLGVQRPGPRVRTGDSDADARLVQAVWTQIGAHYFRSLGLTMPRGREFTAAEERQASARLAILDRATADRLFAGDNPIGQMVQHPAPTAGAPPELLEVIGIAPPIRHQPFDLVPGPHVYTLFAPAPPSNVHLHIRTRAASPDAESALLPMIRQQIRDVDAEVPIVSIETLPTYRAGSFVLALLEVGAVAFVGFGLMALVMAAVGVYGVKAHLVASRTRELAIRLSLGASSADVLRLVLRQGLGVVAVGVTAGLACALLASRALQGVVLTGGAFDPVAFAGAAAVLVVTVILASWLPARRAARVAPTTFSRS